MRNGRIEVPGMPQSMPQQVGVQVASPINDIQLIALIASRQTGLEAKEAVEWATDVVIEAIVQTGGNNFAAKLQARLKQDAEAS